MAELTLPQVFRRAVELIDENGWTQGMYRSSSGCLCATGALAVALGGEIRRPDEDVDEDALFTDRAAEELWSKACRRAGRAVGGNIGDIVDWNDKPGRTVDEVKELLLWLAEEADRG